MDISYCSTNRSRLDTCYEEVTNYFDDGWSVPIPPGKRLPSVVDVTIVRIAYSVLRDIEKKPWSPNSHLTEKLSVLDLVVKGDSYKVVGLNARSSGCINDSNMDYYAIREIYHACPALKCHSHSRTSGFYCYFPKHTERSPVEQGSLCSWSGKTRDVMIRKSSVLHDFRKVEVTIWDPSGCHQSWSPRA